MSQCFSNAGLDYCGQYMGGGNNNNNNNNQNNRNGQNFDLQEALECRRLEVDEQALQYYMYKNGGMGNNAQNYYNYNQNQNNKMELFVGPYCANKGKKIVLGVFMDETCSYAAPSGTYEKLVSQHVTYCLDASWNIANDSFLLLEIVLWKHPPVL